MKGQLMVELEKEFRPEFINRLDDIVIFRQLTRENLAQIVKLEIAKVASRLQDKEVQLDITAEATEFLIDKGFHQEFGARPLRRAVEQYLEDPLSEDLLRGVFEGKHHVSVQLDAENKKLRFEAHEKAPAAATT
jgi:ATP-dependent Clp protease ATP-binding subunit ClpC